MKIHALIALALTLALSSLHGQTVPCGNSAPGGPGGGCTPTDSGSDDDVSGSDCSDCEGNDDDSCAGSEGTNKFNVYTGNANRPVADLHVTGAVGQVPLQWRRFANTRYTSGSDCFGQAGGWRHEYQWALASGSAVSGAARMIVSYPDGAATSFLQQSSDTTLWLPAANVPDILRNVSGVFTLQRRSGIRYEFASFGTGSGTYYRLRDIVDTVGNVTTMTYSSTAKTALLTKVTEPAGRFLQLNWQTLSVTTDTLTSMCSIPYPFTSEDWQEIPSSSFWSGNPGWRAIMLQFPQSSSGYIAEVEFYDMNGVKLNGTVISSGPTVAGHDIANAVDGDPATYAQFVSPTNDWLGMDFGPGVVQKISKIRYRAAAGHAYGLSSAVFSGVNTVPGTVSVISSVQSSTGLSVNYDYSLLADSVLGMNWAVLTNARYNDGTQAIYTVAQMYAGSRPLITEAVDPRHAGKGKHIKYAYNPAGAIGYIDHESDGATNEVIATLAAPQYSHVPVVTKSNGSTTTFGYGSNNGNLASKSDGLGRKTTFAHGTAAGDAGFLTAVTDPLNRTTTYGRSAYGNIVSKTKPDGRATIMTRDSLDLPLTQTVTGPGIATRTTTWTRDANHLVTQVTYPDGTYETYTYNGFGQVLTHRLKNGGTETNAYDARGLKTSAADPLGNITTYTYDANDRLATATDALGRATAYTYDDCGRVILTTFADGTTRSVTYDDFGNKLSETDEFGHATTYTYDSYQRLVASTDPLGRTTTWSYSVGTASGGSCSSCNNQDKPTAITRPDGTTTTFTYDAEWQLLSRTEGYGTPAAATTLYVYDKAGNLAKTTDPLGHATSMTYDSRNRAITRKDALNRVTTTTYDTAGNVLTVTRADGQLTTHAYDSLDRRILTTDTLGQSTAFAYDAMGSLVTLTDSRGSITAWSYDLDGRLLRKTYADATYEESAYDAAGQRTLFRTPAAITRACTYDLRGRELTCDWSDATPDITRAYDAAGRLTSMVTAGVSTLTYAYDAANQLLSETTAPVALAPATFTVAYAYDLAGRRSQLTYPDAGAVTYAYTARGQVSAISAGGPPPLATYTYDLDGRRVQKTLENGVSSTYAYDVADQLTTLVHANAGGELARFAYAYDLGGRRTSKAATGPGAIARTETYGYDAIDQVTSSNYGTAGAESFTYDPMGNRTAATLLGQGPVSYTVNNLNQYMSVGGVAASYDANGNTLTLPDRTFAYDGQSRLTVTQTVGLGGVVTHAASFVYDARNRQVSRTVDGVTTWFIWDNWSLLAEYQVSGGAPVQIARYVHGPRLDEILVQARGVAPTPVYLQEDALGSTCLATDATGAVLERYTYTAYGGVSAFDNAGTIVSAPVTRFLYIGREWLNEVGLNDHRNRFYLSGLGRWLSRDPIAEEGGINLYQYIYNDSVNWMDPDGRYPVSRNPAPLPPPPPHVSPPTTRPTPTNTGCCPSGQRRVQMWKKEGFSDFNACVRSKSAGPVHDILSGETGAVAGILANIIGAAAKSPGPGLVLGSAVTLTPYAIEGEAAEQCRLWTCSNAL